MKILNTTKSLFITLAPIALFTTVFNGVTLMLNDLYWMGLSMLLTAAPLLLFLGFILLFKSLARTGKHLWPVQLTSLTGFLLGLLTFNVELMPLMVFVVSSYLITLLYVYWYSNNQRTISHILYEGAHLPSFTLKNHLGNLIDSTDPNQHPMILMFTRGNWCPLCMAQIQEVAEAYKALNEIGVKVMIISSQKEQQTQKLAEKFNVPLNFLIDERQQLGRKLGILHENGLPFGFQILGHQNNQYYPTVIATDDNGIIIYSDQTTNYRVRPEPDELIKLYQ
ncbi:MAG: peroxiredoxin family protein [Marinicella sp.]